MERYLFSQFQKTEKFKSILNAYNENKRQLVHGLSDEGLAYLCCNLNESISKILILTNDEFKAKAIEENIRAYTTNVERFISKEFILYNVDALSKESVYKRVNVLNKIVNQDKLIVTSSLNSAVTKLMSKAKFKESSIKLQYGCCYSFHNLLKNLIALGYERVDAIEGKGQFSVRGGIIDIFSLSEDNPYRIEFFDDEIDSIRVIDLKTQRSVRNETMLKILPCSDILFNENDIEIIEQEIKKDYNKRLKKLEQSKDSDSIKQKLSDLYENYKTKFGDNLYIGNTDLLTPFSNNQFSSIIDYFDEDSLIILVEPDKIFEEFKIIKDSFMVKYTELFEKGEVFSKQNKLYFDKAEIKNRLDSKKILYHNALLKGNKNFEVEYITQIISKEANSYYGKMEDVSKDLNLFKYKGYKVSVVLHSFENCEKLGTILNDYNLSTTLCRGDNIEAESGQVVLSEGSLKRGFEFPENKILILTENEIYGSSKKKSRTKKKHNGSRIETFADLKVGDFVVHEYHGIGQYVGIEEINVQNVKKDYLCVKYKGEDKLYVPVDQMSLIQKYIGSDSATPKINKLSSQDWVKTKEKTKKAIENMAQELVELYATRKMVKGYEFSQDTEWQKEFEYRFPFEETDDQLRCIKEIKHDMERVQPMDRLLCGDVGFGKTEVALRAVFKAVMDSKQVAILVPTTILAQQHYANIIDRFRGYPIKIEMLSRFRTPYQQKKIVSDLNKGLIDVIVGTHKILSKDLKFKDLGLLVIDEEQRFGVKHKEAIKQLKSNIDVLTLSATPIPRTLHMSMIGVRDMSVIEEPPGERLPIQTYVIEHNDGIIRDAIEREMSRGGQVFYVHNKVIDIESVASKVRKLVPDCRVAVGHGQMHERELENMMVSFVNKEFDVLVCTTIIETGMDIPNVNTLIIDNADHLGLSQLYQLRGRVGRSNKSSFAYLTYERDKVLTEVADKRLKAIREFTEFGSGFKIAMRDLEIRGCGNILGSEQHGHMIAIGYDLYVKYLDRAVKKLSGTKLEEEIEISVDLNVDGYIPNEYISNEEQKIEMYKKIAAISSKDEILDISDEMIDRFGNLPNQVNNLLKVANIKILCRHLNIKSITQANKYINIEFTHAKYLTQEIVDYLLTEYKYKVKFDVSKSPIIRYQLESTEQMKVLNEIEDTFNHLCKIKDVSET